MPPFVVDCCGEWPVDLVAVELIERLERDGPRRFRQLANEEIERLGQGQSPMLCRTMGKNSKANRREDAFRKSGGMCWYCGERPAEHIEHRTPDARGGASDLANLVGACRRCNYAKAGHGISGNPNMNLQEFREEVARRLKVEPVDVKFYGERLHEQRREAWMAAGQPQYQVPYMLGLKDAVLGIKAEPFSFPDEPSLDIRFMDDDDF